MELREPELLGQEGTGTYALRLKDVFIGAEERMAEPARPFIARIRAAFVMLQCGMAVGVAQGAIDSMWRWRRSCHVNQFLEDRPDSCRPSWTR